MKILLCPGNWFPNAAGGEHYLNNLCHHLLQYGHEIKCICHTEKQFNHNGIECYPAGPMERIFADNNELFQWADIVLHQLLGNSYAFNKCKQHSKPNIFFAHNFGKHYFLTPESSVVYNSNFMASQRLFDSASTVLQPLINYRDYKPSDIKQRKYIALINCNENKGVNQFIQLADILPQYQFLGVKGNYGQQITPDKPNITWRENGRIDWSEIKVLLVPSELESWSQVATEAICNGIPVICSDLLGLRENLSYAGTYIHRDKLHLYKLCIQAMMSNDKYYWKKSAASLRRAKDLDPIPRVEAFNDWLLKQV